MEFLTDDILRDGITEQKRTFDSHNLISWVLTKYPQEYTHELYKYVKKTDPVQTLHSVVGKRLVRLKDVIRKCDKVMSKNIRNQNKDTLCEKWEKI